MDVLSEVLRIVRLDGALFFNGEFSAPWCVSEPRSTAIASRLSPNSGHLILYHFLTEGRAFARLPDGTRVDLTAGDVVIFPHGDAHLLGNGLPEKPLDALQMFDKNLTQGLKFARFGGGGDVTRLVCGYLVCEPRLSQVFLAGLPKILKVRITNEPADRWLENSIKFSAGEETSLEAGSGLVLAKLSELLFVETLRRYINSLPPEQTGWLAGARDPVIGQTLALLHAEPAHEWTISNLSRRVGLSRTRLAERFQHFLQESPIAYLTKWRLKLGAETLLSTENSIEEIAAAVGYGSAAAFNRAFRREYDCPPARFRLSNKNFRSR